MSASGWLPLALHTCAFFVHPRLVLLTRPRSISIPRVRPWRRTRSPGAVARPRHAPADPEPTNIVGVFGLSVRTVEQDLEDEFGRVAPVEKVVIVYDARTQRSRGFGFITMRDVEGAAAVIKALNGIVSRPGL